MPGNNTTCWLGSLDGFAAVVLPACERAVVLSGGDEAYYRDSRGLARALTGDTPGAVEDFRAFVEWTKAHFQYEPMGVRRDAWIAALEAG